MVEPQRGEGPVRSLVSPLGTAARCGERRLGGVNRGGAAGDLLLSVYLHTSRQPATGAQGFFSAGVSSAVSWGPLRERGRRGSAGGEQGLCLPPNTRAGQRLRKPPDLSVLSRDRAPVLLCSWQRARGRDLFSSSNWKDNVGKTWSQLPVGLCEVCRSSTLVLGQVHSPHQFTFVKKSACLWAGFTVC